MTAPFPGFPRSGLTFLHQLRRHNDRAWFQAHRDDYDRYVSAPMVELVTALGGVLQGFAPELVTDPKRAIYRIHRDVRFSADKSPYKTQVAATFAPRGLPKHAGAGLYFHVAPDQVLVAGGVYMPPAAELRAIRAHVAEHHGDLERIVRGRAYRRLFGELTGERLSRAPKGYEPDHPAVEWLRYKQYLAWLERPARTACSADFFPLLVEAFVAMMPLIRFLNAPLRATARRFEDDAFAP